MNDLLIKGLAPSVVEHPKLGDATPIKSGDKTEGSEFGKMLTDSLEKVNEAQVTADSAVENLVTGKTDNLHDTMLALEKADLSFKLMMQVRNKIVDAYQEVMRIQA